MYRYILHIFFLIKKKKKRKQNLSISETRFVKANNVIDLIS